MRKQLAELAKQFELEGCDNLFYAFDTLSEFGNRDTVENVINILKKFFKENK